MQMESKDIDFTGLEVSKQEIICMCPFEGMIDIISKKWALLVIGVLGNKGKLRYSRIEEELRGIRPKTLTTILRELEKSGLIKRKVYAEIPPRVEYSLTKDGAELRQAVIPLLKWAASKSKKNTDTCPILKPKILARSTNQS